MSSTEFGFYVLFAAGFGIGLAEYIYTRHVQTFVLDLIETTMLFIPSFMMSVFSFFAILELHTHLNALLALIVIEAFMVTLTVSCLATLVSMSIHNFQNEPGIDVFVGEWCLIYFHSYNKQR